MDLPEAEAPSSAHAIKFDEKSPSSFCIIFLNLIKIKKINKQTDAGEKQQAFTGGNKSSIFPTLTKKEANPSNVTSVPTT